MLIPFPELNGRCLLDGEDITIWTRHIYVDEELDAWECWVAGWLNLFEPAHGFVQIFDGDGNPILEFDTNYVHSLL